MIDAGTNGRDRFHVDAGPGFALTTSGNAAELKRGSFALLPLAVPIAFLLWKIALLRPLANLGRSVWRTGHYWNQIDGSLLAASVSFYACFSVFPAILVLLSAFGFFLQYTGYSQDYEKQILLYLSDQTSQEMAGQIHQLMQQIETGAVVSGPLGLVFLMMIALTLFVNFERAFTKIWDIKGDSQGVLAGIIDVALHRVRAFVMLMAIGLLVFLNFFSHMAIDIVAGYVGDFRFSQSWWRIVHLVSSLTLNMLLFTTIYETLPRTKVPWRFAFRGGILASITWEFGRYALAIFVISDKYHAFGVVGVFMALLMWTFYGASVILLGATYTKVSMDESFEARANRIGQRRMPSGELVQRHIPLSGSINEVDSLPAAKGAERSPDKDPQLMR